MTLRIIRFHTTALAVAISLLFMNFSHAESSEEYAVIAKSVWSAFECTALADKSKNIKEQERLFEYGYKHGLIFLKALQAGKIKREDLSKEAPIMMLLLLQGPTPDFMLGRVFDGALESALKNIYKTGDKFNSDEEQERIAKNEFWKRNCKLLGK